MNHLNNLKLVNYVLGALNLLVALLTILGGIATVGMGVASGADIGSMVPSIVMFGVFTFSIGIVAVLFFMAGGRVARAKGRVLQTILAVLSLPSCPGIFYGAYALWVCWMNAESKALLDQGYID